MAWVFTPVVTVCLQLLASGALGFAAAATGLVPPPHRAALQSFVFHIALPLHVARGVALKQGQPLLHSFVFSSTDAVVYLKPLAAAPVAAALVAARGAGRWPRLIVRRGRSLPSPNQGLPIVLFSAQLDPFCP